MNRVEMFSADTLQELETVINLWCSDEGLEPISVSLMKGNLFYVAAVVVKECD